MALRDEGILLVIKNDCALLLCGFARVKTEFKTAYRLAGRHRKRQSLCPDPRIIERGLEIIGIDGQPVRRLFHHNI